MYRAVLRVKRKQLREYQHGCAWRRQGKEDLHGGRTINNSCCSINATNLFSVNPEAGWNPASCRFRGFNRREIELAIRIDCTRAISPRLVDIAMYFPPSGRVPGWKINARFACLRFSRNWERFIAAGKERSEAERVDTRSLARRSAV